MQDISKRKGDLHSTEKIEAMKNKVLTARDISEIDEENKKKRRDRLIKKVMTATLGEDPDDAIYAFSVLISKIIERR